MEPYIGKVLDNAVSVVLLFVILRWVATTFWPRMERHLDRLDSVMAEAVAAIKAVEISCRQKQCRYPDSGGGNCHGIAKQPRPENDGVLVDGIQPDAPVSGGDWRHSGI